MIKLPSGRGIGPGYAPFIICEVGSNWTSLDDCLRSIAQAKQVGADAVKFQAYTSEALYGPRPWPLGLTQATLPIEWLPKLKAKADACGIEFMCSAFSPELVEAVNPFVNIHKVASAEMTHVRILEAVRRTGKPVILSTGASGERDIEKALMVLNNHSVLDVVSGAANWGPHYPVILLYCVANYPAQAVDLRTIDVMRARFGLPIGYSDHTTDILEIPWRAAHTYQACVLEKHVTFIDEATPDSPHSLTGDRFALMVRNLKGEYWPTLGAHSEEKDMILRHNRRLIATKDIQVGEAFREGENFGIYRSLKDEHHAFSPFAISSVIGKPAQRGVRAGDGIGPGDV